MIGQVGTTMDGKVFMVINSQYEGKVVRTTVVMEKTTTEDLIKNLNQMVESINERNRADAN